MSGIDEGSLDKSMDEAWLLLYERHEALCWDKHPITKRIFQQIGRYLPG